VHGSTRGSRPTDGKAPREWRATWTDIPLFALLQEVGQECQLQALRQGAPKSMFRRAGSVSCSGARSALHVSLEYLPVQRNRLDSTLFRASAGDPFDTRSRPGPPPHIPSAAFDPYPTLIVTPGTRHVPDSTHGHPDPYQSDEKPASRLALLDSGLQAVAA